jgi:hypothetical protein
MFEPDYIVKCDDSDADRNRGELHFSQFLDANPRHGIGMTEVYNEAYEKEYKFQRKRPVGFRKAEPSPHLLGSALYGDFDLTTVAGRRCRDAYMNLFLSEGEDPGSERQASQEGPLSLTVWSLDSRSRYLPKPLYCIVDDDPYNVARFWNLRALFVSATAVHVTETESALARASSQWWAKPEDSDVDRAQYARVVNLSSWPESEVLQFARQLKAAVEREVRLGEFEKVLAQAPECRALVTSAEGELIQPASTNDHLVIQLPSPSFAPENTWRPSWAYIFERFESDETDEVVAVFPHDLGHQGLQNTMRDYFTHGDMRVGTEGLVVLTGANRSRSELKFQVPFSIPLAMEWFGERGYSLKLSSAGTVALYMIRMLGGLWRTTRVADRGIIALFNSLAHGNLDVVDGQGEPHLRLARARVATRSKIMSAILASLRRRYPKWPKEVVEREGRLEFNQLLEIGALKVGLWLQCSMCGRRVWLGLEQIRSEITCEQCSQVFQFPATDPPSDWRYRAMGPFSVENYADGTYAVILALRALSRTPGPATWIPSVELKKGDIRMELDFAMWVQPGYESSSPVLVVGECKSGTRRFTDKDFAWMELIERQLPEAAIVLATMRPHLDETEISAITNFITVHPDAKVIVLCARELFSDEDLPETWRESESSDARRLAASFTWTGLRDVCRITQALYLRTTDGDPEQPASGIAEVREVREVEVEGGVAGDDSG